MWQIIYSKKATRNLQRIPTKTADRIKEKIILYSTDQGLKHTAKIRGTKTSVYRFKTGDYRPYRQSAVTEN